MDIFLRPIAEELVNLYHVGLNICNQGKQLLLRVQLLSGVFDAPARAAIQDFVQFNGYFGCGTCLAEGKSLTTTRGGHKIVFTFNVDDSCQSKGFEKVRTHTTLYSMLKWLR